MPRRPVVRLTLRCDNRCVFCAQDGLDPTEHDVVAALQALWDRGEREVTLLGGEPTRVEELPAIVERARRLGFTHVGLQSNGMRLAERARELAGVGLTDVHLSIHGARAEIHDYITACPGSFDRLQRGAAAARRAGLVLVATSVLTRSTFRSVGELPAMLSSVGVVAWCLTLPRVGGRTRDAFDRIVPRMALALPYALHALAGAGRLRLPAFMDGAPLCLLGPYADRALEPEPLAYAAACEQCGLRSRCPGVDPSYLARFAGDELVLRPGPPPTAPGPDHLARMFVGPGELALPSHPADPLRLGPRHKGSLPVVG